MKFSIVTGLKESNSSESQILEKFTALCKFLSLLGYKGIELAILEPEKIPVKKLKEISDSYDMEIPALGTGATYLRFGYSLGDINPNVREKSIERIKKYFEFALISDSKVIIGLIRGRYSFISGPELAEKNIIASLKTCCELAENYSIELAFEPINRFEVDSFNTIKESLEMMEKIGSNYLTLLIDTFHIHLEEDPKNIFDYLETITNKVSHIHLADDTRKAPGTGHFDFKRFLRIFKSSTRLGFASLETIMKPSLEDVAKDTMTYLKSIKIL